MKKMIVLAAVAIALVAYTPDAQAQGFLKVLKDKAVEKVKEKVTDKVDREVGNAADRLLDGKKSSNTSKDVEKEETPVTTNKSTEDETPDVTTTTQKSDFVRGSQQFFFDDVKGEKVGEFPSKWDVLNAEEEVEVATVNGEKAIKIGGWGSRITPLMKQKYYLGDEFTIEMDVYTSSKNAGGNHSIKVDFGDENYSAGTSDDLASFDINVAGDHAAGFSYHKTSGAEGGDVDQGAEAQESVINKLVKKNAWNTIQISFNTRAMKIYLNGTRIINVPNMAKPKLFTLATWTNSDDPFYYVKNVRVCNGAQELYGKQESTNEVDAAMAATGKFVTNNILFETGKADLKAESMAEIQKVADYMLKNKSVRFEVQGHCDNQGSDAVNDPLSQKRAEAIVAALVKLGVDEWNLRAVGKGSHEPVADNKTEEGRAKNRRVEFIKK